MSPTETAIANVLTGVFVVEIMCSIVALAYILRVFRGARSTLFRLFVALDVLVVTIGVFLLFPALAALLGLPRLPFTGVAVVVAVIILTGAPIVHAIVFWRLRRKKQGHTIQQVELEEEVTTE